jgi:hypothetical protein
MNTPNFIECLKCNKSYRGPNFIDLINEREALLAVVPLVKEAVDAYMLAPDVEVPLRVWLAALPEHLRNEA